MPEKSKSWNARKVQTLRHPGKTEGPASYSVRVVPGLRIQVSAKHVKS
jgi:hypothetical protein